MSTTNHPDEPQSRLDREINEILEEARNRPISFQDRVAQKRIAVEAQKQATAHRARSIGVGPIQAAWSWALKIPLVTALIVAILAAWLASDYRGIAIVLGLIAVAFIFLPFVRRPSSDDVAYQKKWRGRPIESSLPGGARPEGSVRSLIDSARSRFER